MAKHNKKGRSTTVAQFVMLPHWMMKSPAWRSLKPVDRVLYEELTLIYNGSNNGRLALSTRDAAERCNAHRDTVGLSFRRLQAAGFIECATPGGFSRKTRHATEWRLTIHPCNVTGSLAPKTFMRWRGVTLESSHSTVDHGPETRVARALQSGHSSGVEGDSGGKNQPVEHPAKVVTGRFSQPHIHLRHAGGPELSPEEAYDPDEDASAFC